MGKGRGVRIEYRKTAVLVGGAAIQLFTGIPAAWGAFQKGVEEGFSLQTGQVLWIFCGMIAAYGMGCVWGGALQDKTGAATACLLGAAGMGGGFWCASLLPARRLVPLLAGFSVPVGLGCAFVTPAVMSCAQKWWADRKGFATGAVGFGAGLSGAVLTFSARRLTQAGGIRLCFRVLGSAGAAVCLLGAVLLREPEAGAGQPQPTGRIYRPGQIFRTADYWLLLFSVVAAAPTVLLFSPVILTLGQARGLTEAVAAWAIVLGSLTSAVGRLFLPWLSDKIGLKATSQGIFAALTGLSILFGFAQQGWVIATYCGLTLFYSGQAALLPAFAVRRFGLQHSGLHYGLLALGMTVGSLTVPFLARSLQGQTVLHWIAALSGAAGFAAISCYRGTSSAGSQE